MPFSQAERRSHVHSPLGGDALLLQHMSGTESISDLFSFQLDLVSELEELDFGSIVGKPMAVSVLLESGGERFFHGIVSRFEQSAARGRFVSYRAEIVPWFWLLKQRVNCRTFQQTSVPDIVRKIFTELGFSDFRFEISGNYAQREYCVQYRESDFQFISRLLEDEGIGYFFEHDAKSHTLVFFDSPVGNPPCALQPVALYQSASDEGSPSDDVRDLCFERQLRPGAYALNDYNFEQPSVSLLSGIASAQCIGTNPKLEVYDYPGNFTLLPEGATRVRCRMEAEECASVSVRGRSGCVAFTPGYRFDLKGHYRRECNETYLITQVGHTLDEEIGDHSSGGGASSTYENQFMCMPHRIPYRSLRTTPRPIIHGVQTATVVGRPGEEIHVDPHGRVKVQFHWDREGRRNQDSSCWIRVSQLWAGKSWGGMAIPRIGQEVIVEFIEGDPDRPLITGRVYNAEQKPPYELPGGAHVMGMKSSSTPGGGGYNEISIDDTKGKERLTIHAQYDASTTIEHDEAHTVVGGNRTMSVVAGTNTETIKGNASLTVQAGARSVDVTGGDYSAVSSHAVTLHGKSKGVSITGNAEGVTVAGDGTGVSVDGDPYVAVSGSSLVNVSAPNIGIGTPASAQGAPATGITLVASSEVIIAVGGSQIKITPQGIELSGPKITHAADGNFEVTGALVKIN